MRTFIDALRRRSLRVEHYARFAGVDGLASREGGGRDPPAKQVPAFDVAGKALVMWTERHTIQYDFVTKKTRVSPRPATRLEVLSCSTTACVAYHLPCRMTLVGKPCPADGEVHFWDRTSSKHERVLEHREFLPVRYWVHALDDAGAFLLQGNYGPVELVSVTSEQSWPITPDVGEVAATTHGLIYSTGDAVSVMALP